MLDSRRYEVFVGRFARTLELPPRESLGARGATGTNGRAGPDRGSLPSVPQGGGADPPRVTGVGVPSAARRGKRARYTIEFLADPLPRSGSARSQGARRGPGHTRPTPGCGCRDRSAPQPRLPRARPGPTDDLRDGGGRRALPPDHDRGCEAASRRRTGKPRDLVEGLPEGNRRESAGSCLQSRVTDWTGDPSRRMIMRLRVPLPRLID